MKKSLQCFFLFICSISVYAETITWFTLNRPPWFIENGMGYGDRMQASYMALLPQYQHKSLMVNLARMNVEMQKGTKFCISSSADIPAIRRYMHMSKSLYILPRPKIFMKQETHIKMGRPAMISIKKLAANIEYRMGIIGGVNHLPIRSEDYAESQHVTIISNSYPIISIMQMVDLGRIDWAADFPHMVQWGASSGNIKIDKVFVMVDIEEYQGIESLRSGIACTRNSWGLVIIDKLNSLVNKKTILTNREWTSKWMPPGAVKEEFFRLNEVEFGY